MNGYKNLNLLVSREIAWLLSERHQEVGRGDERKGGVGVWRHNKLVCMVMEWLRLGFGFDLR